MSISISFPVSVERGDVEWAEPAAVGAGLHRGRGFPSRERAWQRRWEGVAEGGQITAQGGQGAWPGARGGVASAELLQLGQVGGGEGALQAPQKLQEKIPEGILEPRPVLLQEGLQATPTSHNSQHLLPEALLGHGHQGAPLQRPEAVPRPRPRPLREQPIQRVQHGGGGAELPQQ